ncbi:TIGR03619 family F420-dependent LLM class oxidoreductase [Pseudonocardia eucalypti]|uniref:TIGR03619 family F420-dependent LLM class oxidoreductase n=1 Tax=Pseudonocardia eucalypti TaxID=648755 RepID=A0ABP9Q713_9PSEU|nr:putative F420-dependent oxidoreductase [Pseudonocardia eucalypti]
MKLGISFLKLHPGRFAEVTREGERLGFESVWLSDHLVFPVDLGGAPYPGDNADSPADTVVKTPSMWDRPLFDTTAYLCFLAGQTSTIRFGTYVYLLGLRHPLIGARAFQTLDVVSGGRAEVGIGAGWMESEFAAAGVDFRTRGRRLDECIQVCKRLWTEPNVAHEGEFYAFDGVGFEPKPSPAMRLHVGGESRAAMRRVARYGNGWIGMEHTLESLPAKLAELDRALADAGRSRDELEISVVGAAREPDDLKKWAELGVHRLILTPFRRTSTAIEDMRDFATGIGLGK